MRLAYSLFFLSLTTMGAAALSGNASLAGQPYIAWITAASPCSWLVASCIFLLMAYGSAIKYQHEVKKWLTVKDAVDQTQPASTLRQAIASAINDARQETRAALAIQKSSELQLKIATAQRRQAEAVLLSISDAVLVTDKFDQLLMANEAAARLLGFDLASCNRAEVATILGDKVLCQIIAEARSSDVTSRRIVEHKRKQGSAELVLRVTLSRVVDGNGELSGIVTVLHDMTKEREIAQMKNDFVSNVSHELRTPLASIRAYVEMLIDGEAEDEKTKRNFYEVIQQEANRLGRLIDNILNISRIESGLVKITQEPQSLTVIAKEAIEVIAPQAKLKQIKIDEKLTPIFYQTSADRDMLYQAMLNLLSNAVKYTPENGTVTVQTEVDEQRRCVVARISDTGVGIPPKDLPFVFDKFYRAEANNKMAKGTGLGLSLVKHIIETVHRGKLIVESAVGKGSTFGFELSLSE